MLVKTKRQKNVDEVTKNIMYEIKRKNRAKKLQYVKNNWVLYAMIVPVMIYTFIFSYIPMYGILMAFTDYRVKLGILGSEWIGFEHFERFFNSYYFKMVVGNTLKINIYSLLVSFPLPIIFALLLNYLKSTKLKKIAQMISYAPHFISTVVLCNMILIIFDYDMGVVNTIRNYFGYENVNFMASASLFDDLYVWSGVWQSMGFSAIIYVSSLAGVDQQLHEAAIIDGATKVQRIWHVDLPSIRPTIVMLLILAIGGLMSNGFDKAYMLQTDLNISASELIATYVYKTGILEGGYGYSTAVNLFNTIINLVLLITANKVAKKLTGESLM